MAISDVRWEIADLVLQSKICNLQSPTVSGGHRRRVTPVPIPNTEVKPSTADGTARAGAWESRSLPGLITKP